MYFPCQDLLQHLQNYEWNEDNVKPYENIPDEDKEMEDIAELQIRTRKKELKILK